jgi:K+/H+ antiporter YhaU regulatory subunit KhtT
MTPMLVMIAVIAASSVVVKIAAVALEMTGMEARKARFQALSAFTGTGFTTRDSEDVVKYEHRRRIIMTLMILGNAGFVSVIAAFAFSMRAAGSTLLVRVAVLLIALYALYKLMSNKGLMRRFTRIVEKRIESAGLLESKRLDELLRMAEGYVVAEVTIDEKSPNEGKSLKESTLREHDVLVIAIEREGKVFPAPRADMKLRLKDAVVCYGKAEGIRKALGPTRRAKHA